MFLRMKVHGRSTLERVVRTLLLAGVFLTVMWAFWENNERIIDRLNHNKIVVDETKQMTKEEIQFAQNFLRGLKNEFGLDGKIRIFKERIIEPKLDSRTVFIGIAPLDRDVIVRFPGLIRKALGKEYILELEHQFFIPFWGDGEWRSGLSQMLMDIWTHLEEQDANQADSGSNAIAPVYKDSPEDLERKEEKQQQKELLNNRKPEKQYDDVQVAPVTKAPDTVVVLEQKNANEVLGTITKE
ncbi:MAG: hypothetical protein ACNI27_01065 [Desulfovibrio sp.]